MQPHSATDSSTPEGDTSEITVPPTAMRHPAHGVLDNADIAGHDEVDHEAALRDSMLRVPR
ncbi:hypothetical protein DVT68_03600 [Dyella solisilvae]|uniref:Uncharacterized protein n=1 Tax=Dyella solisilvae TaxID=1920168 RepID=A0A370KB80_9GAMM|nr:hypothetical protein [Dyella solisilvae]RDI99923.1 hypothetical protein DVT68_03600 [Dyella solisilvae]